MRASARAPRPSNVILGVLAAMTAVFLAVSLLKDPPWVVSHLVLTPRLALGREPWQLVTSALVHLHLGSLLSTVIALWFFGAPVEQRLGRLRFGLLLVAASILGATVSAAVGRLIAPDALVAGAGPAGLASIAAFGVVFRDVPVSFFGLSQLRAAACAALFLGLSALFYLMNADYVGLAGALAGAGVGAALSSPRFDSVDRLGNSSTRLRDRWRKWRIRRRYRVIPGGRDSRSYLN
jgi:membrane associated rhomboid family serine protease